MLCVIDFLLEVHEEGKETSYLYWRREGRRWRCLGGFDGEEGKNVMLMNLMSLVSFIFSPFSRVWWWLSFALKTLSILTSLSLLFAGLLSWMVALLVYGFDDDVLKSLILKQFTSLSLLSYCVHVAFEHLLLNMPLERFLGISIFLEAGFLPNDVYTEGFGCLTCVALNSWMLVSLLTVWCFDNGQASFDQVFDVQAWDLAIGMVILVTVGFRMGYVCDWYLAWGFWQGFW